MVVIVIPIAAPCCLPGSQFLLAGQVFISLPVPYSSFTRGPLPSHDLVLLCTQAFFFYVLWLQHRSHPQFLLPLSGIWEMPRRWVMKRAPQIA